jgi:hypothetical protein
MTRALPSITDIAVDKTTPRRDECDVATATVEVARTAEPKRRRTASHLATGQSVWWDRLPWVVLGVCLATFAYGATTISSAPVNQFGLLASASPAFAASILLAALGFAIAIRRANIKAAMAATVVMIVVQRMPRSIGTDYPMYAWTYKHLGVADYIQHAHSLAHGADIYNGWPGLFAITAWFSDLTGVSPISIAHWFTIFFHLGFALIVYAAARAWRLEPLLAVAATFLVATLNWVEQDYYSPQATAMIFAAGAFVLVGLSHDRPVGVSLLILVFAAATITHQLTPYWMLLMIGILVVSRKMRPWWIVFPLATILVSVLLYNYDEVSRYRMFSLDIIGNAKSPIPSVGVFGQQLTSFGVRFLSASMWAAAAVVLLIRSRKKRPFWALGVLALSPMLILGGQNYGREAIFRVFLYSVVGCSIVLAPVFVAALQARVAGFLGAIAALSMVTALSAQGYYGSWFANVLPKQQVDGSKELLDSAEFPSYITAVAPVWPERSSWRYVDFARFDQDFDRPMIDTSDLVHMGFDTDADYDKFRRTVAVRTDASTYLLFTEQARLYCWYFGIMPLDALPNLENRMKNDPQWELVYDRKGITIYRHRVVIS